MLSFTVCKAENQFAVILSKSEGLRIGAGRWKSETSKSKSIWSKAFGEGIMGLYLLVQVGPFPLDSKGLGLCPGQYFCASLESSKVTGTVRVNTQ